MADKFVAKRGDISGSGAANGDVIYLTDQEEVYDVVNTKLTLTEAGGIKISSGVWADFSKLKTLDYRLTKPAEFDSTKKYTKGSLVTKDGGAFIANGDIAVGTTWATGTTGATWKTLAGTTLSAAYKGYSDPSTATSTSNGGIWTLSQIDVYRVPFNGKVTGVKLKTGANETIRIGLFSSSTAKGTAPVVKAHTQLKEIVVGSGVSATTFGSGMDVFTGEYIGIMAAYSADGTSWSGRVPYTGGVVNDGGTFFLNGTSDAGSKVGATLTGGSSANTSWNPIFSYYLEPA